MDHYTNSDSYVRSGPVKRRLTVRANHELENSGYNQIDLTEGFSFLLAGYLNFIHRMLLKIEIPAPFYARY